MKLLLDQNISFRLVNKITEHFPESNQVRQLGLENSTDIEIWNYAREKNYTIVTFDTDFFDFSIIKGAPPKVIWLRTGNTSTKNIEKLLLSKKESILEFISSKEMSNIGCLEIR